MVVLLLHAKQTITTVPKKQETGLNYYLIVYLYKHPYLKCHVFSNSIFAYKHTKQQIIITLNVHAIHSCFSKLLLLAIQANYTAENAKVNMQF